MKHSFSPRNFSTSNSSDLRLKPGAKRINFVIFKAFKMPISFQLSEALLKTPKTIKPIAYQGRFIVSDKCRLWKKHALDFFFQYRDFSRFELLAGRYKKGKHVVSIVRFDSKRYYENPSFGAFLHLYLTEDKKK